MTAYNSLSYAQKQPPATGHGFNQLATHLHATVNVPAGLATTDTINFGFLPPNAIVDQVTLKAATQLDSNGAPTLTVNLGVANLAGVAINATLFSAGLITVGRAAGASADVTIAPGGRLYKNVSGLKQVIQASLGAAAATSLAGTLELDMEFFLEDVVGSAP